MMSKDSHDCEFWLPPQFLTDDDDLFAEFKNNKNGGTSNKRFLRDYQPEFPYGFGPVGPYSNLSSPVEGSTQIESDEEDFVYELNRKLGLASLQDSGLAHDNRKGWSLSASPQSTLCSALSGCECKQGSSRYTPNGQSQVSSPPEMNKSDGPCDLLYDAAGEVAGMRRFSEGGAVFHPSNNGLYGPPRKPSTTTVPPIIPSPNLGYLSNPPHISCQHLKAAQLNQQQGTVGWGLGKYQFNHNQATMQNRGRITGGKLNLSMSAWPTLEQSNRQQLQPQLQKQPGSGMRAVFLGTPSSKRECAGTGVFLPKRFGTPTEIRKKPGCSTVLLPDRVVQALNSLNWEAMDGQFNIRYNASFPREYEAAVSYGNGTATVARPRHSVRPQPVMNQELHLPPEWTY